MDRTCENLQAVDTTIGGHSASWALQAEPNQILAIIGAVV